MNNQWMNSCSFIAPFGMSSGSVVSVGYFSRRGSMDEGGAITKPRPHHVVLQERIDGLRKAGKLAQLDASEEVLDDMVARIMEAEDEDAVLGGTVPIGQLEGRVIQILEANFRPSGSPPSIPIAARPTVRCSRANRSPPTPSASLGLFSATCPRTPSAPSSRRPASPSPPWYRASYCWRKLWANVRPIGPRRSSAGTSLIVSVYSPTPA